MSRHRVRVIPASVAAAIALWFATIAACGGGQLQTGEGGTPVSVTTTPLPSSVIATEPATAESTPGSAGPPPTAGTSPAPGSVGVDPASVQEESPRLIVTLDGEDIGIVNGGRMQIAPDLAVELFLDPFPPNTLRAVLDVYLEHNGEPADDGFVGVEYDMLAMVHGPFRDSAQAIGGGHFLVRLDYIMFGPWDQELTIRAGDTRERLPVIIIARP